MRHYFIDLENVRSAGLDGVLSLSEEDRVYVFYSDNANTLTIPTLESISSSKAQVKYIKINCYGSNAMDFQIVSMFGAMIEREKSGSFYIITHDNGFKAAVSFCKVFFEEYNVILGSFPKIKDTLKNEEQGDGEEVRVGITGKPVGGRSTRSRRGRGGRSGASQMESRSESVAEDTVVSQTSSSSASDESAPDEPAVQESSQGNKKRSRRSRRKGGSQDSEKPAEQNSDSSENQVETSAATEAESENNEAQDEKKRSRRRRSSKNRNRAEVQASGDAEAESKDNSKETEKKAPDLSYIYRALDGLLSEKTTDMYAASIHEAVSSSKDKKALQSFFEKRYQGREAEALYTIVQSEFEVLRKGALKKR